MKSEEFQSEEMKKCLGDFFNMGEKFREKLEKVKNKETVNFIKKLTNNIYEYYSGIGCELCNPRLTNSVVFKDDKI